MTLTATFDGTLSRVQLEADALGGSATYAVLERSHNEMLWETVRGGATLPVTSGEAELAEGDAEFFPDVETFYRITSFDDSDVQQEQFSTSITASLGGKVWLKSLRYPMLNRALFRVLDRGEDRQRPDRGVALDIEGRSVPVSVSGRRGSQNFIVSFQMADAAAADEMDLILAVGGVGGVFLIQVPPDKPQVPGGYVYVHTTAQERSNDRERYVFRLPCTVAAPPGPEVVPTNLTVGTVINTYGSISALWAAHPSIRSLWDTVGSVDDLVVT